MQSLKGKLKSEKGFIALMALGIFGLLIVFGIITQISLRNAANSIKNNNNYFIAQDLANSVSESLLAELEDKEAGYNSDGEINCSWDQGALINGDPANCDPYTTLAEQLLEVDLSFSVKGRPAEGEVMDTNACSTGAFENFNASCYVTPLPGTGTAGEYCDGYDYRGVTIFNAPNFDQLEHACHWNKLSFGNDLLSSVQLPLYHYDALNTVFEPYNAANVANTDGIILRLRAPCLPCANPGEAVNGESRECDTPEKANYCDDADRYVLEIAINDEEIVYWDLTGDCNPECKYAGSDAQGEDTVFLESLVNGSKFDEFGTPIPVEDNKVLISQSPIVDINSGDVKYIFDTNLQPDTDFITSMTMPRFYLSLINKLTSNNNLPVPYLEYQLLTSQPVANPVTYINVEVSVNGNRYKKQISKNISGEFIEAALNLQ